MLFYVSLAVGVAALLARTVYVAYASTLRQIPGPWLAKFTNIWRTYHIWRGDFPKTLRKLQAKYGDVVRIGPNIVSLAGKGQIEKVLGFKEDFIKSDSIRVWQGLQNGKVIEALSTTQDRKFHAAIKKPIANIYSMTNMMSFEDGVDITIKYFLKRLDEEFIRGENSGKPCEIDKWVQYFDEDAKDAFDVIGDISFGRRLGFLEKGSDVDNMLQELTSEFDYRALVGNMPYLDKFLAKNPLYIYFAKPTTKIMVHAVKAIQARLADKTHKPTKDFADRFIEAQKAHPEIVTNQILATYVGSNFAAGSDTTAVVMRAVIYYVHKTPGVLSRLREELDASGTTYPVPYKTAQRLVYLDAVIKEALRIHSIGGALLERVVPKSGFTAPNGIELPPGTIVGMTGWTLHFNPEIYGPDAEEFKPERWLQSATESTDAYQHRLAAMKKNDLSFSYGPRICLGRHIAVLEIYKVLPTLFGLLDMSFVHPEREWRVQGCLFARQFDMDMRLAWRKGVDKSQYTD